jgi:transcriptional regulator with XRE-family HTH domain
MSKARESTTVTSQLRDAIRESGQSLNQLARQSGIGSDRLSRFMRGERDLRGAAIDKLCSTLGLELATRKKPAKGK